MHARWSALSASLQRVHPMLLERTIGAWMRRTFRAISSLLIGAAAFSGCDDSVGVLDPRVPFALEIHVSPDSATLVMGDGRVSTITLAVFAEALEAPVVVPTGSRVVVVRYDRRGRERRWHCIPAKTRNSNHRGKSRRRARSNDHRRHALSLRARLLIRLSS